MGFASRVGEKMVIIVHTIAVAITMESVSLAGERTVRIVQTIVVVAKEVAITNVIRKTNVFLYQVRETIGARQAMIVRHIIFATTRSSAYQLKESDLMNVKLIQIALKSTMNATTSTNVLQSMALA